MVDMQAIKQQLIRHEGLKLTPYRCPAGFLTIGVGRNLETKGISRDEALFLLGNDIEECIRDFASIIPNFYLIGDIRQRVLIDMRFNLGPRGSRSFKKMIMAIKDDDFNRAADEMIDSVWYHRVGERSRELVNMMRTGDEFNMDHVETS